MKKRIPQATICDPPEPTVIDESDLAPGMVAFIRHDSGAMLLVSGWDAEISPAGDVSAFGIARTPFEEDEIRRVAAGVCRTWDYVPYRGCEP